MSEFGEEREEFEDNGEDLLDERDEDPENEEDEDLETDGEEEPETELGDPQEEDEEEDEEDSAKNLVVPGQILGKKSKDLVPGYGAIVDRENNIIALYVGFTQQRGRYLNVVPFKSKYIPQVGDKVIGKVVDKNVVLYKLDIASPYVGILRPSDTVDSGQHGGRGGHPRKRQDRSRRREDTSTYNVGDLVIAKVVRYNRMSDPSLATIGSPDLGLIKKGFITEITVPKIPRLIGKSGSMIRMLNDATSCKIFVAQNGVVWIKGRDPREERVLLKAIKLIENEAHTRGLTDRVKEFIEQELKR